MESWRIVWRDGFLPVLSTTGLTALRDALRADDPRLVQGTTTTPPPLMCVQDWPVEAACALGVCGWIGDGLDTVGQVEEHFAKCCFEADARLGEPGACRWFLNAFDDWPRPEMIRNMLPEVEYELGKRGAFVPAPPDPLVQVPDRMGKPGGLAAGHEAEMVCPLSEGPHALRADKHEGR